MKIVDMVKGKMSDFKSNYDIGKIATAPLTLPLVVVGFTIGSTVSVFMIGYRYGVEIIEENF